MSCNIRDREGGTRVRAGDGGGEAEKMEERLKMAHR